MPQELSLSERIVNYLKRQGGYVCGGEIQKIAASIGYESSNAARRLRELSREGILDVEHRKGQNGVKVSWYRYKPKSKIITEYEKVKASNGEETVRAVQKTLFV